MSLKSFMVGGTGPFTYDSTKDYRNETPITDYASAAAISFVAETGTSSPKITDPNSLFLTAPNVFYPNAVIEVRGSANNDGYYLVSTVEAGTMYLHEDVDLVAETSGAGDVTISTPVQAAYRGLDAFLGSSDESAISDDDGDTKIQCEESADEDVIRGDVAGTQEFQVDANGLTLKSGASVNEFSTDGALAGDSDDAVPTEKATKLYVDTHEADTTDIHGIVDTSKLNTSDAAIVDHTLVRGDGGAQKVQDSGIIVDDSDNVSGVGTFSSGAATINGQSTVGDGGSTNYMQIAADGEVTLHGTARVKKQIPIANANLGKGGTKPNEVIIGNYNAWEYGIGDDSVFTVHVPHDWAIGTDVEINIDWYIDEPAGDEIKWQIVWSATPHDSSEVIDSVGATLDTGDIVIPGTPKFLTSNSLTIPGAGLAMDDQVGVTLSRIAITDGTNPANEPGIVDIHIEYIADKHGEAT